MSVAKFVQLHHNENFVMLSSAFRETLVFQQVQVQRRETERQAQMRLNSYAYLSKLEADEDWVDIKFRDLSNDENVWSKLEAGPKDDLPMDLTPREYLSALLPSKPSGCSRKYSWT